MADAKRGLNRIDVFNDVDTLDAYFKAIKEGNEDLKKWRIRQEQDIAKEQQRAVKSAVLSILKEEQALRESGVKMSAKLEKELKLKALKDYEKERQKKELETQNKIFKDIYKIQTSYDKQRDKERAKANQKENAEMLEFYKQLEESGRKLTKQQKKDKVEREAELEKGIKAELEDSLTNAVGNFVNNSLNSINQGIESYTKNQARINTRLIGTSSRYGLFDKYGRIETQLMTAVGTNPYFRTETMLDNLNALVEAGIVSNLEQRTFLQTAKDEIATTFDAANGALLRIIRLQQSDSTAARLGMEAYLTRFLNGLVENTEYMNTTFDNVASALLEASSAMGMAQATEFEYVVQKWLGALTGTGLAENTAQSIAQAIGYLGSGNIEALGGTNMLNLVTMAASRAGMDIGQLLTSGLGAKNTDLLMKSLVDYMVEIGGSGSNVVKSELAQTFGLTFSDLVAARQLSSSTNSIYGKNLSFAGMYGELSRDMSTIALRTPMAAMIDNLWANMEFGLASNIAKNPALSALWKVTDMIQQNTGGINIMEPFVAGTGIKFNTTIENLMKLGIVGAGSLGMIGELISGLSSTVAPASILGKLGINPVNTGISRGTGLSSLTSGLTTSLSTVVTRANASSSDIYSSTLTAAEDEGKSALQQKQNEASAASDNYTTSEDGLQLDLPDIRDNIRDIVSVLRAINDDVDEINSSIKTGGYFGV